MHSIKIINTAIIFILLFSHNLYAKDAKDAKAYMIFTAGLNEIVTTDKGGYAELAHLLKTYRMKTAPTFFIFGGDSISPSILSSFDQGSHIVDLLNSLEPDVMGVCKSDFGYFEDALSLRAYEAAFPIVQTNMIEVSTGKLLEGILETVIIQQGNYRFGFISLMDEIVIEEYNLSRVKMKNAHQAIMTQVKKMRNNNVDLIIMHYQGDNLNPIEYLNDGTVDLVLRKNDNIKMVNNKYKKNNKQILISISDQVAIIELSWQQQKPQTLTVSTQLPNLISYPKDFDVKQQIDDYTNRLNSLLNEVISVTKSEMKTFRVDLRVGETTFGNLLTDVMKAYASADAAIINSGTIRGEKHYIINTKITRRDIAKELPFRNTVVLLEVTGEQLTTSLENGLSEVNHLKGRYPQVSGIKIVYDSQKKSGKRIISLHINNKLVKPLQKYKIATSDYLANGGDGYYSFKLSKPLPYSQQMSKLLSEIFVDELRTRRIISPKIESRLVDIAKH